SSTGERDGRRRDQNPVDPHRRGARRRARGDREQERAAHGERARSAVRDAEGPSRERRRHARAGAPAERSPSGARAGGPQGCSHSQARRAVAGKRRALRARLFTHADLTRKAANEKARLAPAISASGAVDELERIVRSEDADVAEGAEVEQVAVTGNDE